MATFAVVTTVGPQPIARWPIFMSISKLRSAGRITTCTGLRSTKCRTANRPRTVTISTWTSRKAISDPNHADHDEMLEWVGGEFDPGKFSVDEVNKELE